MSDAMIAEASPRLAAAPWVCVLTAAQGTEDALHIVPGAECPASYSVRTDGSVAVFDGVLHNRARLAAELRPEESFISDAALLMMAYQRWGVDVSHHLDAWGCAMVVDRPRRRIVAIRDSLGAYPLFYSGSGDRLLFSTSIDALREQPGVDRSLNRAALVDHLSHNWTEPADTFFSAIRRIPRGHVLVAESGRIAVTRYWEPVKVGQPIAWVAEDELQPQFDQRFENAVARALAHGPTGIFLSGGLDSISVAAVATDIAKRAGYPLPRPFSLGFPGEADEEKEQRAVAKALGLEHEFVPFNDALPENGLLHGALAMTREQSAPMLNTWMPAYAELVRRAKRQGLRTIMSGAGGDEWLSVTPTIAADMMRRLDFRGVARLTAAWDKSYNLSLPRTVHMLWWKYGLSPVLAGLADHAAPRAYRRNRVRRSMKALGRWGAPDRRLRAEVAARIERWLPQSNPPLGLYFRDTVNMVEHPLTAMEGEETFNIGRHLGIRFRHPYWDPAVADILYRARPLQLFESGRAKSVVRTTMARRFPGLGLEHQKKRAATTFMSFILERELPQLWRQNPDVTALADLGVVEPRAALRMASRHLASGTTQGYGRVWELLNTETWVRAHQ